MRMDSLVASASARGRHFGAEARRERLAGVVVSLAAAVAVVIIRVVEVAGVSKGGSRGKSSRPAREMRRAGVGVRGEARASRMESGVGAWVEAPLLAEAGVGDDTMEGWRKGGADGVSVCV